MMNDSATYRKKLLLNYLLALAALAMCIVIGVVAIAPTTYDVEVGEISPQTITAPKKVVDEISTNRLIEEELAKVGPIYKKDTALSQQMIKKLDEDFTNFEALRAYGETAYRSSVSTAAAVSPTDQPMVVAAPFNPKTTDWNTILSADAFAQTRESLPEYMTDENIVTILSMTQTELNDLHTALKNQIQAALDRTISTSSLEQEKTQMIDGVSEALGLGEAQKQLVSAIVSSDVYPNYVFDEAATQGERDRVTQSVVPVVFRQGQNIVVKGEVVTQEQFQVLKSLGLLTSETTSAQTYVSVIIYISLMFVMYGVFLAVFNRRLITNTKKIAILAILTVIAFGTTVLAQMISVHIYPIIMFVILGSVLLSPKNALVYSVFLSLLVACVATNKEDIISQYAMGALVTMLVGSFFAIYALKDMRARSRLFLAGVLSVIPGVAVEIIRMLLNQINSQQMLYGIAILGASGALCGIASIGVLPLLENAFKLTTPTKLLELSDPTHPIAKRLMMEAPGTFHHSMLVANLAEAGCNVVGGFSLLARVAAYFHDCGKIENPMYFKENQRNNINPHDSLTPYESAQIIKKHVPDGIAMLKKYSMPKEIVEILRDHHGNGTVGYFYAEALKSGEPVDIADYSYEGTPPSTKEGAIVMLADVVEAAVRSLDNPSREDISAMVHKLIKQRYDEGLLDSAPLNRHDLQVIAEAFINIFDGVYHQRIKYPEIKVHGTEDEDNVL